MKTKNYIIILLLIFLLLACRLPGGGPEDVEEVVPTPTESVLTGGEAPATATLQPPTPEPATQAQEPAPTESPAQIVSACNHPYYPILPEVTWHYRITNEGLPATDMYLRFKDITEETFIAEQEFIGESTVTGEIKWECSEEGMSSEYAMINIPGLPSDMQYETVDYSGISIPPPDQWQVGTEWVTNWTVEVVMNIEDMGETTSILEISQENVIAAIEAVSVEAGDYPAAMRVDAVGTMLITTEVAGTSTQNTMAYTLTSWHAENVGIVKQVSEGMVMELLSLE